MKDKGFILVIMLFLMALLAVTATALNYKSGLQARMAVNQAADIQTYYDQLAVIERSLWKLAGDIGWRVSAGENFTYNGTTYNRKVVNSTVTSNTDVISLSVTAPNAAKPVIASYRRFIETPFLIRKPRQVHIDGFGNIFFADYDNHSVWRIDAGTGAITRVAGRGTSGSGGDGGLATEAELNNPRGVCTDALGNVYIADTDNNRIRKVAAGYISTVVNTSGAAGYTPPGDGGAAINAKLNSPFGVWTDAAGNIYIADTDNHRIRKVTATTGIISTIVNTAGNQTNDPTYPLGDGGAATGATLKSPRGLFVDSALNIFIADTSNHRIRKVMAATGIISTVAGITGSYSGPNPPLGDGGAATSAQLNLPYGIWLNAAGDIFTADASNHRIRKVTAASGIITTIAGTGTAGYSGDGGAATSALIDWPTGVAVKSTGEVIIADTNNSCLRQVAIANTISTLPMTVGPALNSPDGVATYYNASQQKLFLYIADQENHRIRRLDTTTNTIVTVAGTGTAGSGGDGGQATAAQLNAPSGVALDASGNLFIADTTNHKIRMVAAIGGVITDSSCSSNCSIISTVAGTGVGPFNEDGQAIVKRVYNPEAVAVDGAGAVYVADKDNDRIRKFTVGGNMITVAGNGTRGLSGDGGAATAAMLNAPEGVWVDSAGNIYIGDTGNHRIRKVTAATGNISTVAGTIVGSSGDGGAATSARLNGPQGVSVDTGGNIYIADEGNHRLRLVNVYTGIITTLAGTTSGGYNGDNRSAVGARLNSPRGVALGLTRGAGRIFIGDSNNNRVRTLYVKTEERMY